MNRSWYWRFAFILAVTVGSLWFLVPSYYSFFVLPKAERNNLKLLSEKLPKWAPSATHRLNLGLDLQGGIYMVMHVDTKTALEKRVEHRAQQLADSLRDRKVADVTADPNPEQLQIAITPKDPGQLAAVQKDLADHVGNEFSISRGQGNGLLLTLNTASLESFRSKSVEQAMLVIRRRIDKWGVAEVDVRQLGTDSIQISLPGQKDTEQAKELIGRTSQLEFRMVDDKSNALQELFQKGHPPEITLTERDGFPQLVSKDRDSLLTYVKGKVPADREVLLHCDESPLKKGTCDRYTTYLVEKNVPLTGESLTDASVENQQGNRVAVSFTLNAQGARDFEDLTAKNVNHKMAIVLDDDVNSAPNIREKIPGGHGQIELGNSGKSPDEQLAEANMLALTLQAGALPAPVTPGEIRQVGATLGEELVKKGSLAALVGLALVVFFMAIYYKNSGLIADVALVLNGVLILAGLALFNATLTLPGIAGFVLTLGIAVDANVLISERIREEVRNGKSARSAVDQGYDRAFWTIFDAHVTTLIAATILFVTGTGPVRGFATSLIIGLLASLFTSIVVTRVITTYFVHGRNAQTVSV